MARLNWKQVGAGPIVVLCLLSAMLFDYAIRGPKAKVRQTALETELRRIADPKSSIAGSFGSSYKTSNGYVEKFVWTDLPPDQVRSFYRETMEQNGWYFTKSESRLSKARTIFCRNDGTGEAAVLELPDSPHEKSYRYSLKLIWGIDYGCS